MTTVTGDGSLSEVDIGADITDVEQVMLVVQRIFNSVTAFTVSEGKLRFTEPLPSGMVADIYCLRFFSQSNPNISLPDNDVEGQMLIKHQNGAISSILTGFVPLRTPDYRYAPIIHTSHCMADYSNVETINLFMNIKKC